MRIPTLACALLLISTPVVAQQPEPRDTSALIASLESRLKSESGNAAAAGELGIILTRGASHKETQFQDRRRAEQLLEQALRADPGNPRYLLAMGELYDKMSLAQSRDRALDRASNAARLRPGSLNQRELADIYYRLAAVAEVRAEDFFHLKTNADQALAAGADSAGVDAAGRNECAGLFCMNWLRPRNFNDMLGRLPETPDIHARLGKTADSLALLALATDNTHSGAHRLRMRMLARAGDWERFFDDADRYRAVSRDPSAQLYIALAHYRLGQTDSDALFRAAIRGLPDEQRASYEDLSVYLSPLEEKALEPMSVVQRAAFRTAFWRARDPLFLTPENEYEIDYYARVALADVLLARPERGLKATESNAARILTGFGAPAHVWQLTDPEGGRFVFWNYGADVPNFIFAKAIGPAPLRIVRKPDDAPVGAEDRSPPMFRPPFESVAGIGVQFVRRRAPNGAGTELLVFGITPPALRNSYANAGLFLFKAAPGLPPVGEGKQLVDKTGAFNFRMAMSPGVYSYSLEAQSVDRLYASVQRAELTVERWSAFAMSDLLLARKLKTEAAEPVSFDNFELEPLRCNVVPEGRRVAVAFELYGLTADSVGDTRYRVSLAVTAGDDTRLPARMLRGLGLSGQRASTLTAFDRQRPLRDGRMVEWFELELPDTKGRGVSLHVTIQDLASKKEITTTRDLTATCR